MRIGIDISQIVHSGTGVGVYVRNMVEKIVREDTKNEYILFGASLRRQHELISFIKKLNAHNVKGVIIPIPPSILDILWNTLHIYPVTWFTGPLDVFWSSDWTQPPLDGAHGITTIHDVSFLRFPESFAQKIVDVQKRRLYWAAKTCKLFLCDSEATKQDVKKFLSIPEDKLRVVYPGF